LTTVSAPLLPEPDARYLDLLMRAGRQPWAIELKLTDAGRGRYLRHAIVQAVLYRRFVRAASDLHPWFVERSLDPTACRAAIAFPAPTGRGSDTRRDELRRIAALFDAIIELDVDVEDLPAGLPEPLLERSTHRWPDYRVQISFATQPERSRRNGSRDRAVPR
jgi:hypothetical protein